VCSLSLEKSCSQTAQGSAKLVKTDFNQQKWEEGQGSVPLLLEKSA
jgi:hypothetical protein